MTKEQKAALTKTFWDAVKSAIGGNKDHGWGKEDSLEVIETVIAEDASISEAEKGKYILSEEAMALVEAVVNPSQFRQTLESKDCGLLEKTESKRKGVMKALLAEMESE